MIFGKEAQKYWDAGLPAIPLMRAEKRPAISRWQLFSDTFPTVEEREAWLREYPHNNIGLPMGPSAGLVAVDIDTDDPKVLAILNRILPPSPWTRVGKKGNIKVYRYSGERTTRIKGADGSMICEILSKGTQFVLPPSIHPDTQMPYTANCHLYDVHTAVLSLPANVEQVIREALGEAGFEIASGGSNKITTFVPAGARDNALTWHAGLLARAVLRGERALLQALGEIASWVENFVEQVVGDPVTVEKAQAKLIEFLVKDVTGEKRIDLPIGWDEGLSEEDKAKMGLGFTEDNEKWNANRIMLYVTGEFERFPDFRDEGRIGAINVAIDRMARAGDAVSVLDEAMILRFIAAQSAGIMTQADLKRQLASVKKGDIDGDNHQQLAAATLRFFGQFGETRFDAGSFWQWRGACWEKKEEHEILKVIAEEFGHYPACRRQADHQGVFRVMKAVTCIPLDRISTNGLNFANGFLTEDLELVDHHPDQGMTYILPYRYMPEQAGHMPMFNQFLQDSWSKDSDYGEKLLALQEAMGATLMSVAPTYQRAICCVGLAETGKSRLAEIMMGLLPKTAVSAVSPNDWQDKFIPAQMYGKVMNFAGELSESRNIASDIFKQVVDGSTISAQHKNQPVFTFRPSCAQWFSSNHLPKTRDFTNGFNRRWLILAFTHRVDPANIIRELDRIILENEKEEIAAWAIEGYRRLKDNGQYTMPASHTSLVDQMASRNNSVRQFLSTSARIRTGLNRTKQVTPARTLHTEYYEFCVSNGIFPRLQLQDFVGRMEELQGDFDFEILASSAARNHLDVCYSGIMIGMKNNLERVA